MAGEMRTRHLLNLQPKIRHGGRYDGIIPLHDGLLGDAVPGPGAPLVD